ncbi:hypothetical protein [Streptomyces sp. NPDC058295]|uniref:hypothetical protein n=1 Tax=Streptomyces sp. NPDC058295 TaxID=3346431 RepID=UPI0036EC2D75
MLSPGRGRAVPPGPPHGRADACQNGPRPATDRLQHRFAHGCHPRSGLLQGAEAYLLSVATRKGTDLEFAVMLRTVIQEWDEQHRGTGAPQPATA